MDAMRDDLNTESRTRVASTLAPLIRNPAPQRGRRHRGHRSSKAIKYCHLIQHHGATKDASTGFIPNDYRIFSPSFIPFTLMAHTDQYRQYCENCFQYYQEPVLHQMVHHQQEYCYHPQLYYDCNPQQLFYLSNEQTMGLQEYNAMTFHGYGPTRITSTHILPNNMTLSEYSSYLSQLFRATTYSATSVSSSCFSSVSSIESYVSSLPNRMCPSSTSHPKDTGRSKEEMGKEQVALTVTDDEHSNNHADF